MHSSIQALKKVNTTKWATKGNNNNNDNDNNNDVTHIFDKKQKVQGKKMKKIVY